MVWFFLLGLFFGTTGLLVNGYFVSAGLFFSTMTIASIVVYRKRKVIQQRWRLFCHKREKHKALQAFAQRIQAMLGIIPKDLPSDDIKDCCEKLEEKLLMEFATLLNDSWKAEGIKLKLPAETLEDAEKRRRNEPTAKIEIDNMINRQLKERQLLAENVSTLTTAIAATLNRLDAEKREKARKALDMELDETLNLIASVAPTSLPDNVAQLPGKSNHPEKQIVGYKKPHQ